MQIRRHHGNDKGLRIMQIKTFLDLCSGIGGGRLGLEQAGLKSVGYSDTSTSNIN